MKKVFSLLGLLLLVLYIGHTTVSFKAGEKTSELKFTKQQYDAVQANLSYAFRVIDSAKIVLHYSNPNKELEQGMTNAQNGLVGVIQFVGQIDSTFKK